MERVQPTVQAKADIFVSGHMLERLRERRLVPGDLVLVGLEFYYMRQ